MATSLSFYKEQLAGETNNYVHLRAGAEQTSAAQVLRQLVNEVLESGREMESLTVGDDDLAALWHRYFQVSRFQTHDLYVILSDSMQGYLEFSLKAERYRLAELGYKA